MTKRIKLSAFLAAFMSLAMWTTAAKAGDPTPGDDIVSAYEDFASSTASAFEDAAGAIVTSTTAKMVLLDKTGATDAKIIAAAAAGEAKLAKLLTKTNLTTNKAARKAFVLLSNLDEETLIDQITDADADRDSALADIADDADEAAGAIADALDKLVPPAKP